MTEILLMKAPGGYLQACDESGKAIIDGWKLGQGVRVTFKKMRNVLFHRKYFAMLDLGFDAWEPAVSEFKGLPVVKNRERFRKDVQCAAGFYELVVNLNGETRAESKSISFGSMDEDEFEAVYSAVADVLLQRVLKTYTRADLDAVVEELMGFVT